MYQTCTITIIRHLKFANYLLKSGKFAIHYCDIASDSHGTTYSINLLYILKSYTTVNLSFDLVIESRCSASEHSQERDSNEYIVS